MKNLIPEAALKKHIAILGMNGSGKTSVAKSSVIEPALDAGERVCNIDPTGVGWGLRLSATGKSKGFPVYIVGGDRADFPLFRRDGKAWAEIVGTSSDSFVFDTSAMTVEDRSQWFTDFAETLIRKNKGPLKLVIDEAHLFAPQGGSKSGGVAPRMLHATNNLLALGRSRGLRITMISQRPAKLHKDSLTQAHTLIAMALMAPQDRAAVKDWIADQADAERGKEIIASLPSLSPGEAWIWAPKEKVLERVRFPRPTTFDSSSAPDDDKGGEYLLFAVDPETIKAKLATVAKETVANDPAALRKRIAELEAAARKAPTAVPIADPKAIKAAEAAAYQRGETETAPIWFRRGVEAAIDGVEAYVKSFNAPAFIKKELEIWKGMGAIPNAPKLSKASIEITPVAIPEKKAAAIFSGPIKANGGEGGLDRPLQKIVDSIRWWNVFGVADPGHAAVAFLAGYKPKTGTWNRYISALRSAGLIEARGDPVLTEYGLRAAREPEAPPTGEALRATVLSELDAPLQEILTPVLEAYPQGLTPEDAASKTKYLPKTGTWNRYVSSLRSLKLIEPRGELKAQEWLFP